MLTWCLQLQIFQIFSCRTESAAALAKTFWGVGTYGGRLKIFEHMYIEEQCR